MTNSAVEPPTIIVHPASTIVGGGNSATFAVTATGADLAYQWYAGQTGDTSQPISGATGSIYKTAALDSITPVWVKITNSAAYSESRTATAMVGEATPAYLDWAANQGLTDISPSADPDGDQRNNLLEFYGRLTGGGRAQQRIQEERP